MNLLVKPQIRLTSELIETFIENTPIAYVILDEQRRIQYINKSFLELRKLDWNKTVGEYCYNISNGGKPCSECAVLEAIITKEKKIISRQDKLPDGSIKFIDDYAIPLHHISQDGHEYTLEIMVDRSIEMQYKAKRNKDFESLVSLMSQLLESKDTYTAKHSDNVHTIAYHIACAMHLSEEEIYNISLAAKLHDIGKVGIPYSIINKETKLTDEEFELIKSHSAKSYDMLKDLNSFKEIAKIVRQHHERIDGKGYPDGLKGEEISLGARIVAVADTFEAMTSNRSYRKALSAETALAEMKRVSGTQLDGEIVNVFERLNFDYTTYQPASLAKENSKDEFKIVNRVIKSSQHQAETKKKETKNLLDKLDKSEILNQIFENTPCGYVLMHPNHNVVYASPYFLDYMGLTEEEVIGKKCYAVSDENAEKCAECSVHLACKCSKPQKLRREQMTNNGIKTFDMYGIPLKNKKGQIEYVIEVILDRTEEAKLEKERLNDYRSLFKLLTHLIKVKGVDEDDKEMLAAIPGLQKKLEQLFNE